MRVRGKILAAAAAAIGFCAGGAAAHHAQTMYDPQRRLSVTGVVKSFAWSNPHVQLKLMVPDEHGSLVEWSLEGGAISQLRSRGWRRNSLVAGERVTVIVHPLRSGEPGGVITRVTRENGQVIGGNPSPYGAEN